MKFKTRPNLRSCKRRNKNSQKTTENAERFTKDSFAGVTCVNRFTDERLKFKS